VRSLRHGEWFFKGFLIWSKEESLDDYAYDLKEHASGRRFQESTADFTRSEEEGGSDVNAAH
jgi:uncharacterized FlgJ-related protein